MPPEPDKIAALEALKTTMWQPGWKPTPEEQAQIQSAIADLHGRGVDVDQAKVDGIREQRRSNLAQADDLNVLRRYMNDKTFKPTAAERTQVQQAIADLSAKGVAIDRPKVDEIQGLVKQHGSVVFGRGGKGMGFTTELDQITGRKYDQTDPMDANKIV